MTPDFALNLSFDGITLLRRDAAGWHPVGAARLDDHLDAAMDDLRRAALALSPAATEVRVLLPSDQIKFLDAPLDGADPQAVARRALDGATPYPLADLRWDAAVRDDRVQIAAVARETLEEAEEFARQHGFRPVALAAAPPEEVFPGEAFFGAAPRWSGARPEREAQPVRFDAAAVPAAPAADPSRPVPPDQEAAEPPLSGTAAQGLGQADIASPHLPGAAPDAPRPPASGADARPGADAPAREAAEPATDAAGSDAAAARAPRDATPGTDSDAAPAAQDAAEPGRAAPIADLQSGAAAGDGPRTDAAAPAPSAEAGPAQHGAALSPGDDAEARKDADAGPAQSNGTPDRTDAGPVRTEVTPDRTDAPHRADVSAPDRTGGAPAQTNGAPDRADAAPHRADASAPDRTGGAPDPTDGTPDRTDAAPRRADASAPDRTGGAPDPTDGAPDRAGGAAGAGTSDAAVPFRSTRGAPSAPTPSGPTAAAARTPGGPASEAPIPDPAAPIDSLTRPRPAPAAPGGAVSAAERARGLARFGRREDRDRPDPVTGPDAAMPAPDPAERLAALRPGAGPVPLRKPAAPEAAPAASPAATAQQDAEAERQRMTVFGARHAQAQIGGKPRFLGLVLTAALILALVGVAAWAAVFLEDGVARLFRDAPAIREAALPVQDDARDAPRAADGDAAPAPDAAADGAAAPAPAPATLPPRSDAPVILSQDEAEASYSASGIWQRAPQGPLPIATAETQQPRSLAAEPAVRLDTAALLAAAPASRRDAVPVAPMPPAPAGTDFDLDARGLVRATAEGAVNPDRVRIFAGRPPAVPPNRLSVVPAGTTPDSAEQVETLQELARIRPAERPARAPTEPQPDGATALPGPSETLDAPGPAPVLAPDAEQPDAAPGSEPPPPATAAVTEPAPGGVALTALRAVAPRPRPEDAVPPELAADGAAPAETTPPDSSAPVEEAALADTSQWAVAQSPKPAARPNDFAAVVKDLIQSRRSAAVREVQPDIPSNASVSKRATEANVIALRGLNLIGVYGEPSNRRALVRLPNGRYQKVKVGDRIDGGRIAAIGEDELRYVKGGRSELLRMP
ncbi:hypothetical protein [Roseivivax sp. CAU 1761]